MAEHDYVIGGCNRHGMEPDGPSHRFATVLGESYHYAVCRIEQQQNENEQLQKSLRLAAGELSTYGNHTKTHPQTVYDDLLEAADAAETDGE